MADVIVLKELLSEFKNRKKEVRFWTPDQYVINLKHVKKIQERNELDLLITIFERDIKSLDDRIVRICEKNPQPKNVLVSNVTNTWRMRGKQVFWIVS